MTHHNGVSATRRTSIVVYTTSEHLCHVCHAFYFLLGLKIDRIRKNCVQNLTTRLNRRTNSGKRPNLNEPRRHRTARRIRAPLPRSIVHTIAHVLRRQCMGLRQLVHQRFERNESHRMVHVVHKETGKTDKLPQKLDTLRVADPDATKYSEAQSQRSRDSVRPFLKVRMRSVPWGFSRMSIYTTSYLAKTD